MGRDELNHRSDLETPLPRSPDKGVGALDGDFIKRCEGIRRAAARRPARRFLGRKVRRTLAGGTEATDVHDYSTGDDYRYVDWHRAARLDELVSRQYFGRESDDVHLLLDDSGSMNLGSTNGPSKFDYACQLAGTVGYLALANQDRVTVQSFSQKNGQPSERLWGRRAATSLWDRLNRLRAGAATTDLTSVAERFLATNARPGLVLLFSDLLEPRGFAAAFDLLRNYGHELFIAHILGTTDVDPGNAGKVIMTDVESRRRHGSLIDGEDRENYRDIFAKFCASVDRYCAEYRLGVVRLLTNVPVEEAVERMLRFGRTHF
jgi:uncharacterized protein (DUF58 family)